MRAKSEYPIRHADQHKADGSDPIPGLGDFIRYDFENVGDWLYIRGETFSPINRGVLGSPSIILDDTSGNGIGLYAGVGDFDIPNVELLLSDSFMQYTLRNGAFDLGYTKGGDILRYSGGGGILFYTTDGGLNGAGDFQVITTGSLDDVAGSIVLDASGGDDQGNVDIKAGNSLSMRCSDWNVLGTSTGSVSIDFSGQSASDFNNMDYNGSFRLRAYTGLSSLELDNSGDVTLISDGDTVIFPTAGDVNIRIPTGRTFTIKSHTGVPQLQWTEGTADLHIPTGGTIVADL